MSCGCGELQLYDSSTTEALSSAHILAKVLLWLCIDVVASDDLTDGLRVAKDVGLLGLLEHGI